jgi:Amt family ammonium transporter
VTPAIISGAVVERISFRAWIVFIFLWATLVYDPVGNVHQLSTFSAVMCEHNG